MNAEARHLRRNNLNEPPRGIRYSGGPTISHTAWRVGAPRRAAMGRSAMLGEQAIRSLEQISNGLGERGNEERDAEG
jgi:hypothetical protein